jgi:hypothetical protein
MPGIQLVLHYKGHLNPRHAGLAKISVNLNRGAGGPEGEGKRKKYIERMHK